MSEPVPAYSSRFYNVKILKGYVAYLRTKRGWTEEGIEGLFELCGRDITFLNSDDQWYDQSFADLFQRRLQEMTGDQDIAYKVGNYSFTSYAQGIVGRLAQGLVSPQVIFKNIGKYSLSYSRGALIQAVKVDRQSALLRSTPVEGCEEKPYQCQNRQGILGAVVPSFGGAQGKLEERMCRHRGDPFCEYYITWDDRPALPSTAAALLTGVLLGPFLYLGCGQAGPSTLGALGAALGVHLFLRARESGHLRRLLAEKDEALQESLRIFHRRYEEDALKQKILFHSFQGASLEGLCGSTAGTIRESMKYDRVLVMLADNERNILRTAATAGFEGDLKELVESAEFNIHPDNSQGFFISVFNSKAPLFVRDAAKKMGQLSSRSRRLLKVLGTKAFIAVPILDAGQALGVLAVENTGGSRSLVNDDMDLLMEVAKFMGHFIPNVRNFEAIRKSEKLAKVLEEQERQLRKIFQKFVPGEAVSRLSHYGGDFHSVQKRLLDVMFVDLIGFTTFSEGLQPEEVADILNTYIDEMQDTVGRYQGRINKIIGDGLLIYFEGPGDASLRAGHAILQCRASLNARLREKGYPPVSLGIGLHRGVCTVGLIGTAERLDYTLIGDTVNVAARIESYTRHTGPNSFCFSSTLAGDAGDFQYTSKGAVALKGRKGSVEIFQLMGPAKTARGKVRIAGQAKGLSKMRIVQDPDRKDGSHE